MKLSSPLTDQGAVASTYRQVVEHGSEGKAAADADAEGSGSSFLKHLWRSIVTDASALARVGFKATPEAEPQCFAPELDPISGTMMPGFWVS